MIKSVQHTHQEKCRLSVRNLGRLQIRSFLLAVLGTVFAISLPLDAVAEDCKQVKLKSPDGKGVMVDGACARYEGEFRKGKLHGKGKITESDGRITEGMFRFGQLYGPGKIIYEDGRLAEGHFINGYLSGQGRYVWKDGRSFEGIFHDGQAGGPGRYTLKDGTIYEGMFDSNPQLQGLGIQINPDGSRLAGQFRNGKPFGDMMFVRPDGKKETKTYAYGGLSLPSTAARPDAQSKTRTKDDGYGNQGTNAQDSNQKTKETSSDGQVTDEIQRGIRSLRGIFGK